MRILCRGPFTNDVEILDNYGKNLELDILKMNLEFLPNESIKANLSVKVTELNLNLIDISQIMDTEDRDYTQELINNFFIQKHFDYFLK